MQNLAREYYRAVHAAEDIHTDSEPEAQLTVPVQKLITEIVSRAELGKVQLIRETRLDGVRPDFAVLHTRNNRTHQKGYIELKAPTVSVDPETWSGRNKRQWEKLKEQAETLIICNGQTARLIINGVPYGEDAELPYKDYQNWNPEKLVTLLRKFIDSKPVKIESVKDLSKRLAIRTADLRDRILFIMSDADNAESQEAANQGFASWKLFVHAKATKHEFADGISQVIAYGLVLAALTADEIEDADGYISIKVARAALETISPVMAAAFAPLVDKQKLYNATVVELQALETLISAIDKKKVNKSSDRRGEPWLYFYEDFLSVYDPAERKKAGVYYTPTPVVQAMTSIVDYILVNNFNIRLGFADPNVTVLDPATGTGTFPLAVIDAAVKRATETRGKAGPAQAAISLQRNLHAFELLPGAYSVAHLRLNQRLRDLSSSLVGSAKVVLTDTLESPENPQSQLTLFGAADVLASEQNRAKEIKLNQKITVVIGNGSRPRVGACSFANSHV